MTTSATAATTANTAAMSWSSLLFYVNAQQEDDDKDNGGSSGVDNSDSSSGSNGGDASSRSENGNDNGANDRDNGNDNSDGDSSNNNNGSNDSGDDNGNEQTEDENSDNESELEQQEPVPTPSPTPKETPSSGKAAVSELQSEQDREPPDDDCLFNPSLPKCAPTDGQCPDGFLMNENEQCFPDKPCPSGFEKRDEDETGRCYPIGDGSPTPTPSPTPSPEPTPSPTPKPNPINIKIINQINSQIRNYYTTAAATTTTTTSSITPTTLCTTPQENTISLAPGTMVSNGVRLLATFDPCHIVDGGAILNLPDSSNNNNLKLLAVDLEGSGTNNNIEVHKAVVMELQRIQRITNDQTLYNVGFARTITGESAISDNTAEDTIQDINALFLWNNSPRQINFIEDNSIVFNAILSSTSK